MRVFLLAALAASGVASECSVKSLLGSAAKGPDLHQMRLAVFKDECRSESSPGSAAKGPDPRQTQLTEDAATRLLNETRQQTAAGHCSDALRSITAYHYGARSAVGHGGVRLSYAIDDWYHLGRQYPPAMDALLRARDEAAAAVLDDTYCGDDSDAFSEVSAINKRIGERARTAELFLKIAEAHTARARDLYLFAEPELVVAGLYREANGFLDPKGKLRLAIQVSESLREYRKGEKPDVELERFERDSTTRDLATLAALLVANGRNEEATAFAAKAKAAFPGEDFAAAMDKALLGQFPPQDP